MLGIAYTGSRVLVNSISLNKTLTKHIWRDRRLPAAPFQEFIIGNEPRESTGMDKNTIVNNEKELRELDRHEHD